MQYTTINSKITFLKMDSAPEYIKEDKSNIELKELPKIISVKEYRKLYTLIGEKYNWLDRIFMDDNELFKKINAPFTHIYTFQIEGKFAGYTELIEEGNYIEILYFGLSDDFIGKGFGRKALRKTIEQAWSLSPAWIQLNTCDLDHENALPTYLKAGFKPYKTVYENKKVII